jgi:hypothetical protein
VVVLAQKASVPNVFVPGTVISSAQVNANFGALADRLAAIEAELGTPAIPDIPNPATATNATYMAAAPVRLPIYKVTPGENGANEGGASCATGDQLIGGGCNGRDAAGTETCMVERNYPISATTWYCRSRKANGTHSECRATPFAVCLKSF